MKIAVVLPGEGARDSAGVRIRHARLQPLLEGLGHNLDFVTIDQCMATRNFDSDLYLFVKIYDARTLVLARMMRAAGRRVGIDVFDDYFSASDDPRLMPLRRWFAQMVPELDLALCGTPAMAARLAQLAPALPCHMLADPAPALSPTLAETLPDKAADALTRRTLEIGWFGIGDNPLFDVGLSDLQAWADRLAEARLHGFTPRLRVLTNPRALGRDGLERIARLPVPALVEEWSLSREADLLAQSLLCFLPVNGQGFSATKSLNRGMTALAGGAQILSAGYPLYRPLEPFVYRDIAALVTDLQAGTLKLRPDTLDPLAALFAKLGDPATEAAALADFLQSLPAPTPPDASQGVSGPIAVLHGVTSPREVHRLVQKRQALSVASPLTRDKRNYDVLEDPAEADSPEDVVLTLSGQAVEQLRPDLQSRAEPVADRNGKPTFRLRLSGAELPDLPPLTARQTPPPLRLLELAAYRQGIARTRALLARLFADPQVILSEQAPACFAGSALEQRR